MTEWIYSLNYYDYGVIIFFIIMLAWGNKSGFVNVSYRILSFVASVFIAVNLYPYISAILRMTPLYSFLCNHYSETFSQKLVNSVNQKTISFNEGVKALGFPEFIEKSLISDSMSSSLSDTVSKISLSIGEIFSKLIIDILALVVLFFVVIILMYILKRMLTSIVKLPVLKTANRLLGTIFGFVLAYSLIYFASGILVTFSGAFSWNEFLTVINSGFFSKYFVEGNFILSLFT